MAAIAWLPIFFERIAGEETGGTWIEVERDPVASFYVIDEIGIYEVLSQKMSDIDNLIFKKYTGDEDDLRNRIQGDDSAGYVRIAEEIFETRAISIFTGAHDAYLPFALEIKLRQVLVRFELAKQNIESAIVDQVLQIAAGEYSISVAPLIDREGIPESEPGFVDPYGPTHPPDPAAMEVTDFDDSLFFRMAVDTMRKWAPPVFAMAIFFMVLLSGITTMQSTISDKRDKMVEILLSSVSASSLMYGKIIGNFLAGLIQMAVYGIYLVIFLHFFVLPRLGDVSVYQLLSFILVTELPLLLLFALSGYLLFSSLYASLGATMEDMQSAGNFQGIVMFLPVIPFIFISHVIASPEGIIAQVGSYIPFTASVVMIVRMTLLDLSLVEIILPLVILLALTLLIAKLSGKIFQTGMLMYGKEVGLKEMWRWVRE